MHRSTTGRSVLVFALSGVIGLVALSVRAGDNPLIGWWKWDNKRTLHNFKLPSDGSEQLKSDAAREKRIVEGQIRNLQSNVTLTYTDKDCTEVIVGNNGMVLSKESFPYRIVEAGKDYVIVDQMKNGGTGELLLTENAFYVEVKMGEFTYRDYFTRM